MQVYRGPRTGNNWEVTDSKPASDLSKEWAPDRPIRFDGTIDKAGLRHTDLGIILDAKDVEGLWAKLQRLEREEKKALEAESRALRHQVDQLKEGLGKIWSLVALHASDAPTTDDLLTAVTDIVNAYRYSPRGRRPRVSIEWTSFTKL